MAVVNTASILGILAMFGGAVGLTVAHDGRREDPAVSASLERACAGLPTDRQLEDTLATARGLSNGGFDQICASLQPDGGDMDGQQTRVAIRSRR
jgi:hypothetical protein